MAKRVKLKNETFLDLTSIVIPTGIDWSLKNQMAVKCLKINTMSDRDFNNILNTGIYYDIAAPSSVGASNYPENTTGVLIVFRMAAFTYQWYLCFTGNIYYRGYYSGNGWSSWKSL